MLRTTLTPNFEETPNGYAFQIHYGLQNSQVEVWRSPKNTPKVALLFHWLRLLQSLEVVKSFQTKVFHYGQNFSNEFRGFQWVLLQAIVLIW